MQTVVCVPAGRKRYLRLLVKHLLREQDTFDRCELWMNTRNDAADTAYIHKLAQQHPDVFVVRERERVTEGRDYFRYYQDCTDGDTIYIKMDDDIVWMSPGAIGQLAQYRTDHPHPLIVIANTLNNTTCNYLREGRDFVGNTSHGREEAEVLHRKFLRRDWEDYLLDDYIAPLGQHSPNHVYAWRSVDFPTGELYHEGVVTEFGGPPVEGEDEKWLTMVRTKQTGRPVCYLGSVLFVHYAYEPQAAHLDSTDLLQLYEEAYA